MHGERVRRAPVYCRARGLNIGDYHWITLQRLPTPHDISMGKTFSPGYGNFELHTNCNAEEH
jgi:hypothetical protein